MFIHKGIKNEIVEYSSGKTGMLSNGTEFDIQTFIPKIEIKTDKHNFGCDWLNIGIRFGEHRDDIIYRDFKNKSYYEAIQIVTKEANLLYPKIYERSTHKNPSITGLFYNGERYQFYLNGFKVTEEEMLKHTEGLV